MSRPVVIADYDPRWPARFAEEKAHLLDVLGDRLVAVEHIGSTAVPSLAAKPIIDILAGVATLAEAEACIAPLAAAGWSYRADHEDSAPARRYFQKNGPGGVAAFHLHMDL